MALGKHVINPLDYKYTIGFEEKNSKTKEFELFTVGFKTYPGGYPDPDFTIEKGITELTILYTEDQYPTIVTFDLVRAQIARDIRFQNMSKKDKNRLAKSTIIPIDFNATNQVTAQKTTASLTNG